jgi:hypothetical protein
VADSRVIHPSPSHRSKLTMSFDPFEARMQFLALLRKLNASQASIQKVVSFAVKYGSRCAEDLWECILEECAKVGPGLGLGMGLGMSLALLASQLYMVQPHSMTRPSCPRLHSLLHPYSFANTRTKLIY